ncbi:hypothetical protein BLNAU_23547 [Blattamonas nauphoetae]|uniref:Transposase n=1 Tax=Blattamonas nauphoetae TaxID=2049346 RepID=A0ABQ9WPX8_9EUKA|nr:hypothetical protein BLNAU_23547 [Blattamonas nauphoetae]
MFVSRIRDKSDRKAFYEQEPTERRQAYRVHGAFNKEHFCFDHDSSKSNVVHNDVESFHSHCKTSGLMEESHGDQEITHGKVGHTSISGIIDCDLLSSWRPGNRINETIGRA